MEGKRMLTISFHFGTLLGLLFAFMTPLYAAFFAEVNFSGGVDIADLEK
jgi:hypothetical protein